MNIGILGIGGVGGYFGGRLAAHYQNSGDVVITFIPSARSVGELRANSLRLITATGELKIRPHQVSTDPESIGKLDVLICATKSYDLPEAIKPLATCISSDTLILPLLNGVSAKQTIQSMFPEAHVLDGCVYVNAKRIAPGVIEKTAEIEKLYFGGSKAEVRKLIQLQKVFKDAGIDSYLSDDIETDIWTKFVFTAGMATSTSFFDQTLGPILQDDSKKATLQSLVQEAYNVALAKGIRLPVDIVEQTMSKLSQFPFEATSSMHRDFRQGSKTEYLTLSKYVADLGDELGVDTPVFDAIIPTLAAREQSKEEQQ